MRPSRFRSLGFTLVELVVSITLLAILAAAAVPMLRLPMSAYMDAALRSELRSEMDTVAAKLRDDLAQAMPNSVRVWPQVGVPRYLEYLEVRAYGRYRWETGSGAPSCPATCAVVGANDALELDCSESCFTTLGPLLGSAPVPATDYVVVNPLGPGVLGGDPYAGGAGTPPGSVKTRLQGVAVVGNDRRITIAPYRFTTHSSNWQFYIVATPVTYECNPATQRLTRYWGYPIAALQPTAFGARVARAPLATTVSECRFNYTPTLTATGAPGRGGVVSMWLRFTRRSLGTGFEESVESLAEFSVKEPA
jgi:MSHA biogenesis protein MshO